MDPITLSLLLLAAAVVLLVGELLLPTHGILGVMGLLCLAGAIGATFYINKWLGLGVFLVAVLASPLIWTIGLKVWERSPVGRRLILQPTDNARQVIRVRLGQTGVAISDLRPMGECDFGDVRLSAQAERGMIRAGETVTVVAVVNGVPQVRPQLTRAPETAAES